MHDEFHVPNVLIVLLYMWRLNSQGYWVKQKQPYKLAMSDSQNYTPQLCKHIHVVHHICLLAAAAAAYLVNFWIGLDYENTTLVYCLFSRDDFDCSVFHTWGTDKSKAVIGGVTELQTWREHLQENGTWILISKPRERNVVRFLAAVCAGESCVYLTTLSAL